MPAYSLKHDQYTIRHEDKGTKKVGNNLQAVLNIYNDLYHLEPLGHPMRFHHPYPKLHRWYGNTQNIGEW